MNKIPTTLQAGKLNQLTASESNSRRERDQAVRVGKKKTDSPATTTDVFFSLQRESAFSGAVVHLSEIHKP